MATLACGPTYTYPLSHLPFSDIIAYCVDDSCDLVARNPWVLNTREYSLFRRRIAVTDAACLDLDTDFPSTRFGNISFYGLQRPFRLGHLYRTHILFTTYSYLESFGGHIHKVFF